MKKQLLLVLFTLNTPSITMEQETQHDGIPCNTLRTFKIRADGCMEIHAQDQTIKITALLVKPKNNSYLPGQVNTAISRLSQLAKPVAQRAKRLSTLFSQKDPEVETLPLLVFTLKACMRITKHIVDPFTCTTEDNIYYAIQPREDLEELGIICDGLEISVPYSIQLLVKSAGKITLRTPYAHVEARSDDVEFKGTKEKSNSLTIQNLINPAYAIPPIILESEDKITVIPLIEKN